MISVQVLCHGVDLKHGFDPRWENVLHVFTFKIIGTCVKITLNYFPCVVLHKVKFSSIMRKVWYMQLNPGMGL